MYPATPEEKNASTAATAWTTLALYHQLERKLVAPEQRVQVAEAIRKATDWLKRRALSGQARWTEYPPEQNFEKGVEYVSVSALVIHTLRAVTGSSEFDALWLRDLPQRVPGLAESEISKGGIFRTKTVMTVDDSRHYRFPWMLRTTVEAYANGTVAQRARALLWIEEALGAPLRIADFHNEFWTMSEILFALGDVQAKLDPKGSRPVVSSSAPAR